MRSLFAEAMEDVDKGPSDALRAQGGRLYCNAAELAGFELISLHDVAQKNPGHMHWQVVTERLG